ncbi:MAG: hypothetical protein ABS81_09135 [Pseudonocardia sp. SCN 72-86]|nr:MAG: hypothetical protein ABS81_09135 [Pseudonocardia sp. SCN 72-86]
MVDELVARLDAAGHPGITPSEHLVFESLPPDGARLTDLAARLGTTHQAVGELVAGLQRRGLLDRRPDPTDGRARLVVLTEDGRNLVRVALREIAAIEDEWAQRLAAAGLRGDVREALLVALDQDRDGGRPRHR